LAGEWGQGVWASRVSLLHPLKDSASHCYFHIGHTKLWNDTTLYTEQLCRPWGVGQDPVPLSLVVLNQGVSCSDSGHIPPWSPFLSKSDHLGSGNVSYLC
jgi:hypothetical protein